MQDYSNYRNGLYDLVQALLDRARASQAATNRSEDGFEAGRNMAYIEVISVARRVAEQFGIDPDELNLPRDPENDLLPAAESEEQNKGNT